MTLTASETIRQIQSLEVVSGHPRVAIRLIELSKQDDTEIEHYSALIEADPGLASRMLALVNSAWYAPSAPITTVQRAVCTLGLGQVRVIALSHCVASLHKSLELNADDAKGMWAASMCKAIAARKVAEALSPDCSQQIFTLALLQDMGLGLLCSIDPAAVHHIRSEASISRDECLKAEQDHFGLDHTQAGAEMANKLALPDFYIRSIITHHERDHESQSKGMAIAELAMHVASLLPHDIRYWASADSKELARTIDEVLPPWASIEDFMGEVQTEFKAANESLGGNSEATPDLMECLAYASEENARVACNLVSQNMSLMAGTDSLQQALDDTEDARVQAEERADRDPLTQLFNRDGWDRRVKAALSQTNYDENAIGLAFFDLDHFKEMNDSHGHAAGDALLTEVGQRMQEAIRENDLICRWGGDEFVVLFQGVDEADCVTAARRVQEVVQDLPIDLGSHSYELSITVGFVALGPAIRELGLENLLEMADDQLYKAKSTERGSFSSLLSPS